ncbi:MAG: winged helix DNA-binding domain-containing protein [candidate division KSB1 bacterium]|nr:winged helix DNA-binding domain-containing protein [candidate division KSB1 bacterium]
MGRKIPQSPPAHPGTLARVSWEEVEARRDLIYRRRNELRVSSIPEALDFVNSVGFCFAFAARHSELPCLWHAVRGERNPRLPEHIQHDWSIGLVWEAKDVLAAERKIYYGKALRSRPTMISLQFFPQFYRAQGRQGDQEEYLALYRRGVLSPAARRIMDALSKRAPQITRELKSASGLARPEDSYAFDRTMAELQMQLLVVKVAELDEPFTFVWDLVVRRFAPEVELAASISPHEAKVAILDKYFATVLVSSPRKIAQLFPWGDQEIQQALAELLRRRSVEEVAVEGEPGLWFRTTSWKPDRLQA